MENPDSILNFWFGSSDSAVAINNDKKALWWSKNEDTDNEIKQRFEVTARAVASGDLDHWRGDSRGILASVVCTDQFPRNIYRGTPDSFAWDPIALDLANNMVEKQWDESLPLIYRLFAYIPFEHSENLVDQETALALIGGLRDSASEEEKPIFEDFYDFAVRHHQVIDRFGRFPHRNTILGRQSTDEELEFLNQPGSSF